MSSFKFRTDFARDIFRHKYAQGPDDSWPNLCRRLVSDVCGDRSLTVKPLTHPLMSKDDQAQLIQYMIDMKFIPGGRYLYYCFTPKEKILKQDYTWSSAEDIVVGDTLVGFDEEIRNSKFKPTKVTYIDRTTKSIYKVITNLGEVTVSEDHQFVARRKLIAKKKQDAFMWIKAKELLPGSVIAFSSQPWEVDTSYDAGWLAGFMDGEGTVSKGSISISQKPGLALDNAVRILTEKGINFYISSRDKDTVRTINIRGRWESVKVLGMFRPQRLLSNWYKNELGSFWSRINPPAVVESVEYLGEGEVCVIETDTHTLIGNGFLSHNCGRPASFFNNCFSFIAEEDTREEWAAIAERVTSALMSGGGIGVDYSILRPSGRTLSRTGGISSGPIPLMHIVNEIGRNVMQGGSRRSAMLASLNWQHDDIDPFLAAKDWDEEMRAIKAKNFDFPLPLDMTNISVNYDTDFIELVKEATCGFSDKRVPAIWYQNVKQMCQTGEPGMCFNFYENEKDTGRNACAEFTTEDDSDV